MPYIIPSKSSSRNYYQKKTHYKQKEKNDKIMETNFPWVSAENLNKTYVITIRPQRYSNFVTRVGQWSTEIQKINGVNGHNLNILHLGEIYNITSINMKRGRMGCFISHRNVWKQIINEKNKISFILEDDVNLVYSNLHSEKLKETFEILSNKTDDWDIAYLCHFPRGIPQKSKLGEKFEKTTSWHVLCGYAITLKGAEILYKNSIHLKSAVDVYIGSLAKKMLIQAVKLKSPICNVKYVGSDTEGIL